MFSISNRIQGICTVAPLRKYVYGQIALYRFFETWSASQNELHIDPPTGYNLGQDKNQKNEIVQAMNHWKGCSLLFVVVHV